MTLVQSSDCTENENNGRNDYWCIRIHMGNSPTKSSLKNQGVLNGKDHELTYQMLSLIIGDSDNENCIVMVDSERGLCSSRGYHMISVG